MVTKFCNQKRLGLVRPLRKIVFAAREARWLTDASTIYEIVLAAHMVGQRTYKILLLWPVQLDLRPAVRLSAGLSLLKSVLAYSTLPVVTRLPPAAVIWLPGAVRSPLPQIKTMKRTKLRYHDRLLSNSQYFEPTMLQQRKRWLNVHIRSRRGS